jgi:molecular chaperone GrpE
MKDEKNKRNIEVQEEKTENKKKTKKSSSHKNSKLEELKKENEKLKQEVEELNEKYLRLMAEFDNYRRRTLNEKAEMIKNAGEKILFELLPIVDDFERAIKANESIEDVQHLKEGFKLIYDKFVKLLKKQGVSEIEALDKDFDPELHDALTKIPVDDPDKKDKVVDVLEKGYYLNDKILRHSKVVVGDYQGEGEEEEKKE